MVVVASVMALSLTTGTTSADQVTGTFQFVQKGQLSLYGLGSATGLKFTLLNNGQVIASNQAIPFFGTTGTLKKFDNQILTQAVNPGRLELYFINPTGGTLTVDFILEHISTR
jgi:hypothetical protein